MADKRLGTYLDDHLAGSTAAIELMKNLEEGHPDTKVSRLIAEMRVEVEADRRELMDLIHRLGFHESRSREAAAWLAEKMIQIKMRWDDQTSGPFRIFESLEALSLGIEGKLALWRALAVASEVVPDLTGPDYECLAKRAQDQRSRVEVMRLETARVAFAQQD